MRIQEPSDSSKITPTGRNSNGNSDELVVRLRRLVSDLFEEIESLEQRPFSLSQTRLLENGDNISFYDEVRRYEIALIMSALAGAQGHQCHAARLLNLKPSTLNAKIKQYNIRRSFR